MSAKIKTAKSRYKHFRPKGTRQHQFERVYWPYLPIVAAIGGLAWFGMDNGNFSYAYHYGVQGQPFDPQIAFLPLTSKLAAIGIWSVLIAAFGTLIIKHLGQIKRSLRDGERYFIRHPGMDIGLVVIISLAYLLSQTTLYAF
jgi:hypothetical protein